MRVPVTGAIFYREGKFDPATARTTLDAVGEELKDVWVGSEDGAT